MRVLHTYIHTCTCIHRIAYHPSIRRCTKMHMSESPSCSQQLSPIEGVFKVVAGPRSLAVVAGATGECPTLPYPPCVRTYVPCGPSVAKSWLALLHETVTHSM